MRGFVDDFGHYIEVGDIEPCPTADTEGDHPLQWFAPFPPDPFSAFLDPANKVKSAVPRNGDLTSDQREIRRSYLVTSVDKSVVDSFLFQQGAKLQPLSPDEIFMLSAGFTVDSDFDLEPTLATDVLAEQKRQAQQISDHGGAFLSSRRFALSPDAPASETFPFFFGPAFKVINPNGTVNRRTFFIGDVMVQKTLINLVGSLGRSGNKWYSSALPTKEEIISLSDRRRGQEIFLGVTPIFNEDNRVVCIAPPYVDQYGWHKAQIFLPWPGSVVITRTGTQGELPHPIYMLDGLARWNDRMAGCYRGLTDRTFIQRQGDNLIARSVVGYNGRPNQILSGIEL